MANNNNNNQVSLEDQMNAYSPNSLSIFPDLLQLPAYNPVEITEEQLQLPANPLEITQEQLDQLFTVLEEPRVRQPIFVAPPENRFMYDHLQHELTHMPVDENQLFSNHLPLPQPIMAPLDGNRFLLNHPPPLPHGLMPLDHENRFLCNHLHLQHELMPLENPFLCTQYLQQEVLRSRHAGRTPRPTMNIDQPSWFPGMMASNMYPTRRPRTTRRAPARPRVEIEDLDPPPGFGFQNRNLDVPIPPPREVSPEPEARVNNTDCSICMSPFYQPTTTKCGHVFCWRCITHALVEMRKCPICRTRMTRRDLFRIYLS